MDAIEVKKFSGKVFTATVYKRDALDGFDYFVELLKSDEYFVDDDPSQFRTKKEALYYAKTWSEVIA